MSIGEQLRQARQGRAISLEQAAQATRIRVHYLQALESDAFDRLPSAAQGRGFLRAYAHYLKLDAAPLLANWDPDQAAQAQPAEPPQQPSADGQAEDRPTPPLAVDAAIFAEVGKRLASQREVLGLSIDDVERHTRIRGHYLRALEAGDLSGLPSPVQGRGMLSNYAAFLGLDPDALLLQFADGLQAGLAVRRAAERRQAPSPRPASKRAMGLRRFFSGDLLVGTVLVVALVAFTAWATLRISELTREQEPVPTSISIAEVLASSPTAALAENTTPAPDLTLTPGAGEPVNPAETGTLQAPDTGVITATLEAPTPVIGASPLQIYVVTRQRAWMRVTVDDEIVFEGRTTPGGAYTFAGDRRIELVSGDAAALQIFFNQQDIGPLGLPGRVVERIFTLEGVQTPTLAVSLTPTPTITPTPGASPTPTATPTLAP